MSGELYYIPSEIVPCDLAHARALCETGWEFIPEGETISTNDYAWWYIPGDGNLFRLFATYGCKPGWTPSLSKTVGRHNDSYLLGFRRRVAQRPERLIRADASWAAMLAAEEKLKQP